MAKVKTLFRCSECGATAPRWVGKCAVCDQWNTLVEEHVTSSSGPRQRGPAMSVVPVSLQEALAKPEVVLATRVEEFDRVLSGGLVRGSVTLLGGEPGIGKSTLVLQICDAISKQGGRCLIATGEESVEQVARRAHRLGVQTDSVRLLATGDVGTVTRAIDSESPAFVVIDSVQTMSVADIPSAAGGVTQVRESAAELAAYAKDRNIAMILIGHVTKDGALAGPRVLEHLVDTVIEFEGERHQSLRFLRAVKHRFGTTDEVGVLEMTSTGLLSVPDASGLFLDGRHEQVAGSVIVPVLNGRRTMLVEVQALVAASTLSKRIAQGLDTSRVSTVLASLAKHAESGLGMSDVYASVVGGLRVVDPGVDLGLVVAVLSSFYDKAVPNDTVVIGEVGLGGEVRKVSQLSKRLHEAARLGFRRALVPTGVTDASDDIDVIEVGSITQVASQLHLQRDRKRSTSGAKKSNMAVPK